VIYLKIQHWLKGQLTQDSSRGFSLVEILIALPIASVLALVITTTMYTQYGDLQKSTARVNLRMEGEITLISLEDELLFSTDFGEYMKSDLSDSYAPPGGWSSNTTPNTLIVYETALTADRRDANRDFVFKNLYGCSSVYNPIAIDNLMYFTQDNAKGDYKTLFRRTVTPQYTTCNTNFKIQSCPAANVGSGGCNSADAILSDKVVDFTIDYYDEDNVFIPSTGNIWDAEKVKVNLTLGEKIFGDNIQVVTSITMKKVN